MGLRYGNPPDDLSSFNLANQLTQIKSTYELASSKLETFNCQNYALKELPSRIQQNLQSFIMQKSRRFNFAQG